MLSWALVQRAPQAGPEACLVEPSARPLRKGFHAWHHENGKVSLLLVAF